MIDHATIELAERATSDRAAWEAHDRKLKEKLATREALMKAWAKEDKEDAQKAHELNAAAQRSGAARRRVEAEAVEELKALNLAEVEERAAAQEHEKEAGDARSAASYVEHRKKTGALPDELEGLKKRAATAKARATDAEEKLKKAKTKRLEAAKALEKKLAEIKKAVLAQTPVKV